MVAVLETYKMWLSPKLQCREILWIILQLVAVLETYKIWLSPKLQCREIIWIVLQLVVVIEIYKNLAKSKITVEKSTLENSSIGCGT